MVRHLLTLADLSSAEIERIFSITEDLKTKFQKGLREALLPGRVMALVFEKPSLRTRVSFEAAMGHLGGTTLFLGADVGFRHRESLADFGRVLSEYVDVIVIRSFLHETVEQVAEHATCAVINGLTDFSHPCQAMADLYTLRELNGPLAGSTLAWVGDANNVARSLAIGCARLGMNMVMATPPEYRFTDDEMAWLARRAGNLNLTYADDPADAVREAAAVYTDVWVSMGQEKERDERLKAFAPYQVNARLMACAPADAVFMHCLPARRGEEVTDDVLDGPQSVVVQQAGNRMHAQKGILAWLLAAKRQ